MGSYFRLASILIVCSFFLGSTPLYCQTIFSSIEHHQQSSTALKNLPTIVLHGGPSNFTSSYLQDAFQDLNSPRSFIFYDQVTCNDVSCNQNPPLFHDFILQFAHQVDSIDGEYGVMIHSWGLLILLEYYRQYPEKPKPVEVVIVSPIPFTWAQYWQDSLSIFAKLNADENERMHQLMQNPNQCHDGVRVVLKNYFADLQIPKNLRIDGNCYIGNALLPELQDYDYLKEVKNLPKATLWLRGQQDVFTADANIDWVEIPKAGHFPFIENKQAFKNSLNSFYS